MYRSQNHVAAMLPDTPEAPENDSDNTKSSTVVALVAVVTLKCTNSNVKKYKYLTAEIRLHAK